MLTQIVVPIVRIHHVVIVFPQSPLGDPQVIIDSPTLVMQTCF